ncbi:efflux RND transporter permease subunit, partial [Desulfobacterales bacterium HSG17]|nr:efflux RND transporter permease subunit [Desulfobacterales bacterium HSG17]
MTTIKSGIAYLADHPTAANLLMALFILMGLMTVSDLRRETFPDFSTDKVQITNVYPGATASDVELSVCRRIEDAIEGVSNIVEVTSIAQENRGSVTVEMLDGADFTEFFNDIKTEVDAISDFPDEVEDVIVKTLNRTDQVLSIAVSGPMTESHLKLYSEELKDRLTRLEKISQVDIWGFSTHQLLVEIPFYNMMRLGLSISDIEKIIRAQSIDLPAGSLETNTSNILIRFTEERRSVGELESLVVVSGEKGDEVHLGDIATITDRFENKENKIYFNGKRASLLQVNKTKSQDALDILDEVKTFLAVEKQTAPPGVSLTITQNASEVIRDRLQLLVVNGLEGLILVFITMWLFFSFRFSFWVTMGLPVSFLMALFFMKQIGFSLNMLSMVGLLIALGLLMDDAIVIAENVAAHLEKGKKPLAAVVDGVSEVATGVFSSFLTTLFIFGALALSMEGNIGKILFAIPVVLILTLSVSLVEAFCILPNHLSHSLAHASTADKESRFRTHLEAGMDWVREKLIGKVADIVISWRYLFIGSVILLFLFSISMIIGGILKVEALPATDGDVLQARILLPQGTPLHRTEAVVEKVVSAIKKVDQELTPAQPQKNPLLEHISILFNTNADAGESGPHVATVSIDLLTAENRNATIDQITSKWREYVGELSDVINISYKEPGIGPGGLPIEIRLMGNDLSRLKTASTKLINWLYAYEGVADLNDDLRPGKPEFTVKLKKGALAMGYNAQTIAGQLRAAFLGLTAAEIQQGDESFDVTVKIATDDAESVENLEMFHIIGPNGVKVPLKSLATIIESRGFALIKHVNGDRAVTITGDVDTRVANTAEIINHTKINFFPELLAEFPEITISTEGENRETQKTMQGMVSAFFIGIFGVFALLSFQFRSYIEPMVIMLTIPFALIGVIWGHIMMGLELSMPSIMGFISLAGIVVNDSILLVSFIRIHLARGEEVDKAATLASRERFRAVLLTSITTVMGLLPLLSEKSMQAQMLIPLACSIVFGILTSTVLVLFVVPSLYAILADFNL